MRLGEPCAPPTDVWFDLHGNPAEAPLVATELFERTNSVLLGPLDSQIDGCLWHRVVAPRRPPLRLRP